MRCKDCEKHLPDFVTNALSNVEMQAVREHLQTCVHCRKEQEILNYTFILLDEAKHSENLSSPAINLLPGIHARINARKRTSTLWVSLPRFVRYAALPAVVLIVGLFMVSNPKFSGKDEQLFTEQEKETFLQKIDAESLTIEELLSISRTSFEEISSNSFPDIPDDAFANAQESLTPISENEALSYALITVDPEDVLESLPLEVSEELLDNFEHQSLL